MKYILIAVFLLFAFKGKAQTALLCNQGFDAQIIGLPTSLGILDIIDCWKDQNNLGYHSPDWFYHDNFHLEEDLNGAGYVPIMGNQNTNGYVGMRPCEAIQQKFSSPLQKGLYTTLSFYLRIPGDKYRIKQDSLAPMPPKLDGKFRFYFSKKRPTYTKASLCSDGGLCWDMQGSGSVKEIIEEIKIVNYPSGTWYQITTAPFKTNKEYEWLTISLTNEIEPEDGESCEYYYLIDGVNVTQDCLELNCDESCSIVSGDMNPVCNALNTGSMPLIFKNMSNVSSAAISIFDLNGSLVYTQSYSCPNGWLNDTLSIDLNGSVSFSYAYYTAVLSTSNDCGTCIKSCEFLFEDYFTQGVSPCPCRVEGIPKKCCDLSVYADQYQKTCQIDSTFEYSSQDALFVGVNSNFEVHNSDQVDFISADRIVFGNQFATSGTMTAEVKPCTSSNKMEFIEPEEQSQLRAKSVNFNFYPNPSNGNTTFINHSLQDASIDIFSIAGQHISNIKLKAESRESVSLSNLSNGVYILYYSNGTEFSAKRLELAK